MRMLPGVSFARTLRRLMTGALLSVLFWQGPVWALAPDIEMDRLLLAAEERIGQSDYAAAIGFLERIPPLKVAPPPQYYFLEGKARFETGDVAAAKPMLERYVEKAGREGEHYQAALQMLTRIEQQDQERAREQQNAVATQAGIETSVASSAGDQGRRGEAYDAKVQSLYLGVALKDALVMHINDLLRTYAYIEGKIKNLERASSTRYSVSVRGRGELVLTETRPVRLPSGVTQNQINVLPLNTFGLSPFVSYRCSEAADSCYIKHPASGDDWIKVAYDEQGAGELAMALERLIKALQRG